MRPISLTEASLPRAARHLAERDDDLAVLFEQFGPPPLWAREQSFATLLQIILEQQVSQASAGSMFERLARRIGSLTPERFIAFGESSLRALGVTRQKATYFLLLAHAIADGTLDLASLVRMSDDDVRAELTRFKGIGPWTADCYLLLALCRSDVWPSGDLALATSVARVKRLRKRPSPQRLNRMAEAWRPFRAVAARMFWQSHIGRRE